MLAVPAAGVENRREAPKAPPHRAAQLLDTALHSPSSSTRVVAAPASTEPLRVGTVAGGRRPGARDSRPRATSATRDPRPRETRARTAPVRPGHTRPGRTFVRIGIYNYFLSAI